jgi:cobaltochelatase CobN
MILFFTLLSSSQFRDIATSRIHLINKAIKLAANASANVYPNYLAKGTKDAEEVMKENGIFPLGARFFSLARVFGGVNGHYGTGVMGLVESGVTWDDEKTVAEHRGGINYANISEEVMPRKT